MAVAASAVHTAQDMDSRTSPIRSGCRFSGYHILMSSVNGTGVGLYEEVAGIR